MKQIGTKIYYCNLTGNVIQVIRDMQGDVIETTFDEDYKIYTELKERDKKTISLLTYKYGEFEKLSKGSTGVKVNLETKEPIFTFDKLPETPKHETEFDEVKEKISRLMKVQKKQDKILLENTLKLEMLNIK